MHVSGLFVYPIKSCRGYALDTARLGRRGIAHDREFALTANGRVLTQRECPTMALIEPILDGDGLVISAPGMAALVLRANDTGDRRQVEVWGDLCVGVDQGDAAADWFTAFLGMTCRLVRMADDHVRPVDIEALPGREVGFADGYPLLLIGEGSLDALNARMPRPLPMDRFRPNIVVSGASPYAEDGWDHIRIGQQELRVSKPCVRCVVTTTDQQTGERGVEPLRTLSEYRRSPLGGVTFGQNVAHFGDGNLRVRDAVEVVA